MKLGRIEIRNFRNHLHSVLDCSPGINALFGDNGEGKTNIVEAVSYLCLTKSFYASSDAVVLKIGRDQFDVRGRFTSDSEAQWSVEASYESATAKKTVTINKNPIDALSSVVGQFPAVILSPEQNGITFGAPTERRKFLDLAISQASKLYLEEMLEYRRILRQRNKILFEARQSRKDCTEMLEPWNESLISTGSSIITRREKFIEEFQPIVEKHFLLIAGEGERPGIRYVPSFELTPGCSKEIIEERFAEELRLRSDEERRTAATAAGPHRDEIDLSISDMNLRKFASQGQHKTFLVALKLGEFSYLKEQRNETPILLLDDVFSELDEHRSRRLLDFVEQTGQVFITSTDDRVFPSKFGWKDGHSRFLVRGGEVHHHAETGLLVN